MKSASCGLDVNLPVEICSTLKLASDYGFEFVCLPLVHPRFKREFIAKWKDRPGPLTRSDLVLKSNEWNSLIAGKISPYLNIDFEFSNGQAKFAIEQELSYGSHLDLPAIIISLRNSRYFNLARIINSHLIGLKSYQIWIEIPMISHEKNASLWRSDLNEKESEESTWEWWSNFYTLCNLDKRLGVVLEVTKTLPDEKELQKWMGEPIKCLIISTSTFLTNKKGYPVLSKAIQYFIKSLVPYDVQIIIKGNNHHYSFDCYQKYIDHLWQEANTEKELQLKSALTDKNAINYPLKPSNGPENIIFEKDSLQCRHYKKAIHKAILDCSTEGDKSREVINIMIVDAGRGSLIFAALQAAEETKSKVKIYVVEKNPCAIVSLQAYQEEFWQDTVEIIFEDFRFLQFPQIMDIIISESLGSFGDNKLSPEISDKAQTFLKRGGILIPQSYTSYICPVQGSKIYSDVKTNKNAADYEIPYTIAPKQMQKISSIKPLFSFNHPNYSEHIDNSRFKNLTFEVDQNCILHGFTGFYEVVLYKDVHLGTKPDSCTPEPDNPNPIFFPLQEPVYLRAGDKLEAHFWRIVGKASVWYEWSITQPISLPIHNPNGRSSKEKSAFDGAVKVGCRGAENQESWVSYTLIFRDQVIEQSYFSKFILVNPNPLFYLPKENERTA